MKKIRVGLTYGRWLDIPKKLSHKELVIFLNELKGKEVVSVEVINE